MGEEKENSGKQWRSGERRGKRFPSSNSLPLSPSSPLYTPATQATSNPNVVPKLYRLEGQPRSTRNEYPIRSAFENSRQIQYGDLLAFFSLRSNKLRGQSTRRRSKRSMFYNIKKTELRKADRTVGVNRNIFYPIFRQARPDFFRVCLQLRKDVTI